MSKYNVVYKTLKDEEIIDILNAFIEEKFFTKLFNSFLTHFKSNRHNLESLKKEHKSNHRISNFLNIFESIYTKYNENLKQNKCIDFDDMIIESLKLIEDNSYQNPYKHVFIDEFQDISTTRFNLVKSLIKQNNSFLTVVGDDWQSINRFAGSNIDIIQTFHKTFKYTKTIPLDYSFRFDNNISLVASDFIQKNPHQLKKEIKTIKKQEKNKFSIFIFWETDKEYGKEEEPRVIGIYKILDLIKAKEGKNQISVLILSRYNFNLPIINELENYPTFKIKTMTIHGSKGLEADYVILLDLSSKDKYSFPSKIEDDPILDIVATSEDDFENAEERRLFYVALTRTMKSIFISGDIYQKSIFMNDLIEDYKDYVYLLNDPKIKLMKCPECKKGFMKLRNSLTKKDKFFYGCSNYPYCEHTEKLHYCPKCKSQLEKNFKTNMAKCTKQECDFEAQLCKSCNGYLIERNSKYGKFLGCINFPKCNYTKNIKSNDDKIYVSEEAILIEDDKVYEFDETLLIERVYDKKEYMKRNPIEK